MIDHARSRRAAPSSAFPFPEPRQRKRWTGRRREQTTSGTYGEPPPERTRTGGDANDPSPTVRLCERWGSRRWTQLSGRISARLGPCEPYVSISAERHGGRSLQSTRLQTLTQEPLHQPPTLGELKVRGGGDR